PANLARIMLHHRIAQRHLPVAPQRHLPVAADGQDRSRARGVYRRHHDSCVNASRSSMAARLASTRRGGGEWRAAMAGLPFSLANPLPFTIAAAIALAAIGVAIARRPAIQATTSVSAAVGLVLFALA